MPFTKCLSAAIKSKKVKTVCKILSKNQKLIDGGDYSTSRVNFLIEAVESNNKRIIELLFKSAFPEIGNLEKKLIIASLNHKLGNNNTNKV